MAKIDKNANIYDIDGNLISKAPQKRKTISEVEDLVDELTQKVQEEPDNEVYKVYLNNAQKTLFGLYNTMSREELMSRMSILQNGIESAKERATNEEKAAIDKINDEIEKLKTSYDNSEYVDYEELPEAA